MSVEYTGTPGPKGPRSMNLRRALAASATNTPFRVPMVTTTRSAISASRNRGQEREHVPSRQDRVDPVEVTYVVRVHEHVQVASERACLVTDVAVEGGLAPFQVFERRFHGAGSDLELRRAAGG